MTRQMVDSDNVATMPGGYPIYAANINGTNPQFPLLAKSFPGALYVPITVNSLSRSGIVGDAENGDGPRARWITWVAEMRAIGADPWLYCGWTWHDTLQWGFGKAGIPEPWWWVADPTRKMAAPAGRVLALQQTYAKGYDLSIVADYLPGVDPAPQTQEDADSMNITAVPMPDGSVVYPAKAPGGHAIRFREKPTGAVDYLDLTDKVKQEAPNTPDVLIT